MIIFLVTRPEFSVNVILNAIDREQAKRNARHFLGGDPDYYVVTPLTDKRSRTVFMIEAQV